MFFFFTNCKKDEPQYQLSLSMNIENSGIINGGGTYSAGDEVNLTAVPNSNFSFYNWTEGETVISTNANFTYTVPSRNVTLVANFLKHNVLILQPDGVSGKDAYIYSYNGNTTANAGAHPDFAGIATTASGIPVYGRSLIQFDFSTIPSSAIVDSVFLYLYGQVSVSYGGNITAGGSNQCFLQRLTENWDESTVTWANQPNSTDVDQVIISESTSEVQNYVLDITESAGFMINNPTQNFGYILKLNTESYYRRLVFASSDHSNASLHPKVIVYYSTKE